ncbi:MAG: hypothetical protein U1E62_21705 [Alsobacter sp.]
MSLARLALRLATIRALRGATFAEDRVFDSAILGIDFVEEHERMPVLVVTTDDDEGDVEGIDLAAADRKVDLVIEMAVGTFVKVDDNVRMTIPHTDEGLELSLDLMGRDVLRALQAGDSEWSLLWRAFALRIDTVTARRGSDSKDGLRFAARQLVITVQPLAEPPFGQGVAAGPWATFLTALRLDPQFLTIADLVEASIAGTPLPDWRQAEAALGLTRQGVAGIGLAPVYDTAGEAAKGTELRYGDRVVIEAGAAQQLPE